MSNKKAIYDRQYYLENKERLLAQAREKGVCEICNGKYTHGSITKHLKSQKHQLVLKVKEDTKKELLEKITLVKKTKDTKNI